MPRAVVALMFTVACSALARSQDRRATITVDRGDSMGSFDPIVALGSTVDGHTLGSTRYIFTRANVAAMKSANFHPISYRLRTELGIEAWHWNPHGAWSDPAHEQGYWTSKSALGSPIMVSYGYRLPRRGNSIDQANDDGYSRLTDGNPASFWKSNPYLDARYTHESGSAHPQWVIADMDRAVHVSAIRIDWGMPFATRYRVQYWPERAGEELDGPDENVDGAGWTDFAGGVVNSGALARGGESLIGLAAQPVHTRWIRILLLASSHRAPHGSSDPRDAAGFAIREISIGRIVNGSFEDISHHAPDAERQTRTYASSTDPWHRSTDRDPDTEQPGIDLMFASGITRGLPMMIPVGVLYDTPANDAALLRYVRRRHYAAPRMELGEEPDGQFVSPDDFGSLYVQVADSLRDVDPTVILGGPSLQDGRTNVMMSWKQGKFDDRSWFGHFIDALSARGHMNDLAFASFEFYPYDDACTPTGPQLASVTARIRATISQFRSDGLGPSVALMMTEYGYSPFATESEMDLPGAILNSEAVAEFLSRGGAAAFLYGTEPSNLDRNQRCSSWGDNTLFVADDKRRIRARNATFHAARMLTTLWADSSGGANAILASTVRAVSGARPPIDAFALHRPDNRISLLIVNRDPTHAWTVELRGVARAPTSSLDAWRLSRAEYEWHPRGEDGFARPNTGPRRLALDAGERLELPPYSIFVVRER